MQNTIIIFLNLATYYSYLIYSDLNDENEQCFSHTDTDIGFTFKNLVLNGSINEFSIKGLVMYDQEMKNFINFCPGCGDTFAIIDEFNILVFIKKIINQHHQIYMDLMLLYS